MKKIVICIMVCVVLLSGCGKKNNEEITDKPTTEQNKEVKQKETTQEQKIEAKAIAVSREEVAVEYKGNLIIKCMVADTDTIYLGGKTAEGKFEIHKMNYEEDTSELLPVDIPEDIAILKLDMDARGNLYAFWSNAEKRGSQWGIWQIDKNGAIVKEIDIDESWNEEQILLVATAIDNEGNFYLRGWKAGEAVVVLNEKGENIVSIPLDGDDGLRGAMGKGKDGKVYVGLLGTNGSNYESYVALVDIEEGKLNIISDALPNTMGFLAGVGEGTDSDLLLYGPGTGIISYSINENEGKSRVSISRFPAKAEGNTCFCFLPDGRMCFLEKSYKDIEGEFDSSIDYQRAEGSTIFYIPAGK